MVSDIHGNRRALAAVEALARERGAEAWVCLGDVIGRGDPVGCVEWVTDHARLALVGNRDLDYLERVALPLRAAVVGWKREATASDFIASHGDSRLHPVLHSAAERDGFRRVVRYLEERGARVWFFGHTHRDRVWEIGLHGEARAVDAALIEMRPEFRYVVNVGTTGKPLGGRGPAAFCLYDDTAGILERVTLPRTGRAPEGLVRDQTDF
jgi:predicted phosphodiesterase